MMSASTSPDKQDALLRKVFVDGLPAYQFEQITGMKFSSKAAPLRMGTMFSLSTNRFLLLEDPKGEKLYMRYQPENPISESILKSFHFVR